MIEALALAALLTAATPGDEEAEALRFQRIADAAVVTVYTPSVELVDRVVIDRRPPTIVDDRPRLQAAYDEAGPGHGVQASPAHEALVDRSDGAAPQTGYLVDDGDAWIVHRPDGTISDRIMKGDDVIALPLVVEVTTEPNGEAVFEGTPTDLVAPVELGQ